MVLTNKLLPVKADNSEYTAHYADFIFTVLLIILLLIIFTIIFVQCAYSMSRLLPSTTSEHYFDFAVLSKNDQAPAKTYFGRPY